MAIFEMALRDVVIFLFAPPPIPYLSIHDRNVPPVSVLVAIE